MKRALLMLAALLAGAGGCSESSNTVPVSQLLEGELELELRDTLSLRVDPKADGRADFELTASAAHGLLPAGTQLSGSGFVDELPEAYATLYRVSLPISTPSDGRCAGDDATISVSLHRQGDNATVVGGISVYCGGDTSAPPVAVLRLFGNLARP